MNNERCIRLLSAERDAVKRIIAIEVQKAVTAGGDALQATDFVVRRSNVVEAYDYAIRKLQGLGTPNGKVNHENV